MGRRRRLLPTFLVVCGLAACSIALIPSHAQNGAQPLDVLLGESSELWLEGTSTLHDYESRTSQVELTLTRQPGTAQPADDLELEALIRNSGVEGLELNVPVLTLVSKKKGLDKKLWETLQAEKHPTIQFRLSGYRLNPETAEHDTMEFNAIGTLTVAGEEQPDTLDARVFRNDEGVWLEGTERLLMSDFGIKPPKMMLGMLKTHDPVTIHFRLHLVPGTEALTERSQP